ncbi:hypothetical protein C8R45DRAFT_134010 [Mycena sanguinolenta]|nr:hypothetical protein C8R45DRAFT_134010 [Mycena sanguinolenta]
MNNCKGTRLVFFRLSTMKHGFLNSAKAKSRPLGGPNRTQLAPIPAPDPAPSTLLSTSAFGKQPKVDISLPEGFEYGSIRYEECDPGSRSTPGIMNHTSVPFTGADEQVSECFFFSGSKEVLMGIPNFPHPILQVATPAFRLTDVPGKGAGLLSTRALKTGDLILDERPLFVCARGVPIAVPPIFTPAQVGQYQLQKLEEYCEIAINRMRPEAKNAFMALWNCHKEDGSGPIMGIVRTNGLSLQGLRPGVQDHQTNQYSAVCKDISRLNHSCSPNTASLFHLPSFSYRLYAVRDIAAGEELTFHYTDVKCSTEKRQAVLKPYDFACACPACRDTTAVSSEDARTTSDWRRSVLTGFYAVRKEQLKSSSVDDKLLDECCRMIELIVREGLEHLPVYFEVVKLLMQGCIAYGDAPGAREWAARLEKCYWDENRYTEVVTELLKSGPDYRKHTLWRTLVKPGVLTRPRNVTQMLKQLAALGPGGTMVPVGAIS